MQFTKIQDNAMQVNTDDGKFRLVSYTTEVAEIDPNTGAFVRLAFGCMTSSASTVRNVNAFRARHGKLRLTKRECDACDGVIL